ncbi:MAG: AraC family transcriptional regulator [Azoarcus sp.]|nr:AraC family transcriptional regulator [Azoarcus sp.]
MLPAAAIDTAHYRRYIEANVSLRRFPSGLGTRRHALWSERGGLPRALILLSTGRAVLSDSQDELELNGPALVLLSVRPQHFIRLAAGTPALVMSFSDVFVVDAIGKGAESVPLRYMAERPVVSSTVQDADLFEDVTHAFRAIERELARSEDGSWRFLTAQLAVIMIQCWRLSGLEAAGRQSTSTQGAILMRFRHMVELHFREHWRIAQYAEALDISPDRLHDICVRTLKRTPLDLVHDRLAHEACQQLVRSGLSIEQVAEDLGFRNATHFSRFFRIRTNSTPARYRNSFVQNRSDTNARVERSFADWP